MCACGSGGGGNFRGGRGFESGRQLFSSKFGPGATQGGSAAEPVRLGVAPRVAPQRSHPWWLGGWLLGWLLKEATPGGSGGGCADGYFLFLGYDCKKKRQTTSVAPSQEPPWVVPQRKPSATTHILKNRNNRLRSHSESHLGSSKVASLRSHPGGGVRNVVCIHRCDLSKLHWVHHKYAILWASWSYHQVSYN